MITVRKATDRGQVDFGWLKSAHTFSFGNYYDPKHMNFRALRVINDDFVAGGSGFPTHPHDNMEIVTYVLSGTLAHKDSTGGAGTLGRGDVQAMTAGRGIRHSEYNPSESEEVHLLQIWLEPDKRGHTPAYAQKYFTDEELQDQLRVVASGRGAAGALAIHQDVDILAGRLAAGAATEVSLAPGRHAWVQVALGEVSVNGTALKEGDGAAISDETAVRVVTKEGAEVLVFDLA